MLPFTKWFLAPTMVCGMMVAADSNQAKAQFGIYAGRGLSINIGGGYPGYRSFYAPSHRSLYGHGFVSPYRSYQSRGHYLYHRPEVISHGNHLHLVPGHYDYYPRGHHGYGHGHHGHGHHGHGHHGHGRRHSGHH